MIGVVGASSKIAEEFMALVGSECVGLRAGTMLDGCSRYFVCTGMLNGQSLRDQPSDRVAATFAVNFSDVAKWCDDVFHNVETARIVVMGSWSGCVGSHDMAYAGSKAALHLYVETKKLKPDQQLVAIAPGIVQDAGMTVRRPDQDALAQRAAKHPKGRFVTAREVASLAAWLLGPDGEYCSGTTIRLHGGERR